MNDTLQSVLHPGGWDAAIISQFAWVLFGAGTLIFVAVMALLYLSLRRRERPARALLWIGGGGIAFPVVVLTALLAWSTWRSAQLAPQTSHGALNISVTAKMWWWEVRYHDPASGIEVVTANEIHIPTGRAVHLGLNSADVIHSLWIPSLAGKRDMVPGRVTSLTLRAEKPGIYRGQCAEFCGAQHAKMALHVVASSPQEFESWLARQAQPAQLASTQLLERGRAVFLEQRCQACHTIRGLAEGARLGPDLTHVGSRMYIGAGLLRTHRDALGGWIADPQKAKPGVFMPGSRELDSETLNALSTYLEHLK
ncbi:cytochrome c oxidase subunit II [Massilia sp. 9I]|uniref:cytochrome c oxidase subunit II n=1 Tax=Massilia sp. 9I TaxID=2653152 RepID=UPI0012F406BC|nr:cytochrome c oxidase subunit II [Massilia sp. 9I]VXC50082.1 Cytochrome c oxidase polypeptide II [Massilia sp. 9I]